MRLPLEHLFFGGRMRGLFREAIRGLVPDRVRLRPDKASADEGLRALLTAAGGFAAFAELTRDMLLDEVGLVDAPEFRRALAVGDGDPFPSNWARFWPVIALEAFLRYHRARAI